MLIPNQIVLMKWVPKHKKYYESKGYIFSGKFYTDFEVKVKDLPDCSNRNVKVQCDYCGKIIEKEYQDYIKQNKKGIINKDCCKDCQHIKVSESNLLIYGTENINKLKEVKQKRKNTFIEKYNVENIMYLDETKNKIAKTNLNKYGTKAPAQNEEIKNKIIKTNNIKYGGNSPSNNKQIRQKQINTNILKYGYGCSLQNEDVARKAKETLYQNGTAPVSMQQIYINNLLNGELNYPHNNLLLDIAFPEEKIYLEVDLGGHDLQVKLGNLTQEQFDKNQRARWYVLYRAGWKEIRIISSNDKIPNDDKILEIINYGINYLNTGRHFIRFYLDEGRVKTSQFENDYDFGNLRYIYKKDIT